MQIIIIGGGTPSAKTIEALKSALGEDLSIIAASEAVGKDIPDVMLMRNLTGDYVHDSMVEIKPIPKDPEVFQVDYSKIPTSTPIICYPRIECIDFKSGKELRRERRKAKRKKK